MVHYMVFLSSWRIPQRNECYWEMKKFIVLALKANPNILECLFTPIVEKTSEIGEMPAKTDGYILSRTGATKHTTAT